MHVDGNIMPKLSTPTTIVSYFACSVLRFTTFQATNRMELTCHLTKISLKIYLICFTYKRTFACESALLYSKSCFHIHFTTAVQTRVYEFVYVHVYVFTFKSLAYFNVRVSSCEYINSC